MRKLLIFLVFAGLWCTAQAAPLKLTVHSDAGEALWYAYVYVNGRAVAVTDTCGVAQVSEEKLNFGDTLSVSYVGTEPQWVVYDKGVQKRGKYAFVLPEKYALLTTDEVVVKADIERLYRKKVQQRRPYYYMSLWTADFGMKIKFSDDRIRSIVGQLKFPYIMGFQTNIPRKLITSSDTTGLSWYLDSDLTYALTSVHTALYVTSRPDAGTWKPSYSYRGKQDGNRIFRISYTEIQPGISYQLLIKANEESGEIKEMVVDIVDLNDGSVARIKSTITTTDKKAFKIPSMYAPISIQYDFRYKNNTKVFLNISKIRVEQNGWSKKAIQKFIMEK